MVTGASRGIGREVALALADAGLNVVVASRDLAGTSDLVAQLHGKGVEAFAVATDLSDPDAVRALAAEVTNKVDISLLYNNAGVQAP
jgi:NAD(P)-dependent dehydrogenase (short-subunit alcohol dehydrogenase family)